MHFYDAELLRARAKTYLDPDTRAADLEAAMEVARRQDAPLFELRSALDDYDLRGGDSLPALREALAKLPADCALPEAVRARDALTVGQLGA